MSVVATSPPGRKTDWWAREGRDASSPTSAPGSDFGRRVVVGNEVRVLLAGGLAQGAGRRDEVDADGRGRRAGSEPEPIGGEPVGIGSGPVRIDGGLGDDRRGGPARGIQRHVHDATVAPAAGDERTAVRRHRDVAVRLAGR